MPSDRVDQPAGTTTNAPLDWRPFTPEVEEQESAMARLRQILNGAAEEQPARLEEEISAARASPNEPVRYAATLTLVRDLLQLGWQFDVRESGDIFVRPHEEGGLPSKEAVRRQLLHGRADQLRDTKVRDFIERLERPTKTSRQRSIENVIVDGPKFARTLRRIAALPRDRRPDALREVCRPYLEVATLDGVEPTTRAPSLHVWRYFRHTWASRFRRPPGRSVAFLIRDAAQEGHPVLAITALSSAVIALTPRDDWAGWTPDGLRLLLDRGAVGEAEVLRSLRRRVLDDLTMVYTGDLGFDGADPPVLDDELERRLIDVAAAAQRDRGQSLSDATVDRDVSFETDALLARARSPLFRAKRASAARSLLKTLTTLNSVASLRLALDDRDHRDAISAALRQLKQHYTSASIMDITTCGAVPPCGPILAGKLACLLMMTPFVRRAIHAAYAGEPSVIASQMAGRPIVKSPSLALLCTTSLYPERSSQYNRVRLPPNSIAGLDFELRYDQVGRSKGHGATNLSSEAEGLLARVAAERRGYRNVNFMFGEGQSAKMRELREATDALNLGRADILDHSSPRIVFVAPLVAAPQRVLLGLDSVPDVSIGDDGVEAVAEFWRSRWLASRLDHAPVLDELASRRRTSLLLSREYDDDTSSLWLGDAFK